MRICVEKIKTKKERNIHRILLLPDWSLKFAGQNVRA